jgi:histidine-containing phosphotransfer peotein
MDHQQQQRQSLLRQAQALQAERDALAEQCAREGVLDDQFAQLLSLQDDSNPDFVLEVVGLYFDDSAQKAQRIAAMVGLASPEGGAAAAAAAGAPPPNGSASASAECDFAALDAIAHQFKGSSASLGARQVALACSSLRDACVAGDLAAAQAGARQMAEALAAARARLEAVAALERRRKEVAAAAAAAAASGEGGAGGPGSMPMG